MEEEEEGKDLRRLVDPKGSPNFASSRLGSLGWAKTPISLAPYFNIVLFVRARFWIPGSRPGARPGWGHFFEKGRPAKTCCQ